jgi:predicted PurR-regulated permease PerM
VIRGVGPVSGAAVIIGAVPLLMFLLLVQKKRLKQKLAIVWGDKIDVSAFATSVTDMVRGFVLGNFVIGVLMSVVTAVLLLGFKLRVR